MKRIHKKKTDRKKRPTERSSRKTEDKHNPKEDDASDSASNPGDKKETDESNVWKDAGKPDEEKAREDEFEEYLEDLFL